MVNDTHTRRRRTGTRHKLKPDKHETQNPPPPIHPGCLSTRSPYKAAQFCLVLFHRLFTSRWIDIDSTSTVVLQLRALREFCILNDKIISTRPGVGPLEVTIPMVRSVEDGGALPPPERPQIGAVSIPCQSPLGILCLQIVHQSQDHTQRPLTSSMMLHDVIMTSYCCQ